MTNLTIYNVHHWFYREIKGVSPSYSMNPTDETHTSLLLTIENDKVTELRFRNWRRNRVWNHTKSENDDMVAEFVGGKMTPNARLLELLFGFTGVGPDNLLIKDSEYDIKKIYELIYGIEFTSKIRMVWVNTCGCNMGNCSAVLGYSHEGDFTTVGELFDFFAFNSDEMDYHEYPDSVILTLNDARTLPPLSDDPDHQDQVDNQSKEIDLQDNDICYMTASYDR